MLIIDTSAALARALRRPADPSLALVLATRGPELAPEGRDLADLARVVVADPGDTPEGVQAALGLCLRGRRPATATEWLLDRGDWFEATFRTSGGFALVLLAPLRADTCPGLLALCRRLAAPSRLRSGRVAAA